MTSSPQWGAGRRGNCYNELPKVQRKNQVHSKYECIMI